MNSQTDEVTLGFEASSSTTTEASHNQEALVDCKQSAQFQQWIETEKITMHFNDLLVNLRIRAIASISLATGGFAALIVTREESARDFAALGLASLFLALIWISIWIIDATYYQRLLKGAVNEALRIEAAMGTVKLSHSIESCFTGSAGRWCFYSLPLLALIAVAGISFFAEFF